MVICPAEKAYTSTVPRGARISQFGYLCPAPVFNAGITKKSWSGTGWLVTESLAIKAGKDLKDHQV